MGATVVTVERVISAPPESIFDLLADPARHPDIDGSGTVRSSKPAAPARLALGSTFGMGMKLGVPYSMVNTVVEFEENRRIAWQARPPWILGRFTGGRIWRYELDPTEGGTRVRESWDPTTDHQGGLLSRGKLPQQTRHNMAETLARIDKIVGSAEPSSGT